MSLLIQTDPVPLSRDADGGIRIGGTRVTLDVLIAAYDSGATPEQIAEEFDTLKLADVYAVIAYYLRHQSEVREYLREREDEAARIQAEIESRFDPTGIKQRLLDRRSQRDERSAQ